LENVLQWPGDGYIEGRKIIRRIAYGVDKSEQTYRNRHADIMQQTLLTKEILK
jgi:hypothetical protein